MPSMVPGQPPPLVNVSAPLTSTAKPSPGLSQWIVGTDPDCCGPIGNHTPLMTELYLRSGLSFPFGGGQLERALDTGWAIEGGGRALLFNDRGDAAWTLDLGLLNIHNAEAQKVQINLFNVSVRNPQGGRLTIPSLRAEIHGLNRTFVNLGPGREWYLFGSARGTRDGEGAKWRVGIDGGGRYGTDRADIVNFRHFTDTIGGIFGSIHTDVDIPYGCCTFFGGIRGELDYTWSDVLQIQNKSQFGGFNLMVSLGVRY